MFHFSVVRVYSRASRQSVWLLARGAAWARTTQGIIFATRCGGNGGELALHNQGGRASETTPCLMFILSRQK